MKTLNGFRQLIFSPSLQVEHTYTDLNGGFVPVPGIAEPKQVNRFVPRLSTVFCVFAW